MAEMKLVNAEQLDADFTAIASAIREKNGSTEKYAPGDMAAAISAIQTGGGGGAAKDYVKFYDYEGTLLHSYSKDEVEALTELPPLPSHDGLICQGWNWSLEDIKAEGKETNVGAMYITDDGKTRLYITIEAEGRMDVPLYFSQTIANGVTIDWGDGSATETLSPTGNVNAVHSYTSLGDYVISLDVADGCALELGRGSSNYCVMGPTSSTTGSVYSQMLRKVEIGDATNVKDYALVSCKFLTSVTMPKSVTKINTGVFYYCLSLTGITIPDSVRNMSLSTFEQCASLASIAIPNSVQYTDRQTFSYCFSLERITIPNSFKGAVSRMFSSCQKLKSVKISDGTTSIGDYAFENCYDLTGITIPDSVTSIGAGAFSNCRSLPSITIPDSVKSIGNSAFSNCNALTSITIPGSVTSIPTYMLYTCQKLKSVKISDGTTSIGDKAFQQCNALVNITIPDSVKSIGNSAFSNCNALTSITIPGSVTSIGASAFNYCVAMKFYDFTKHTAVPTLADTNAFKNIPSDCEIRVPAALYDEWIAATNWSTYAANIVAK